jgi:hypothetical protein
MPTASFGTWETFVVKLKIYKSQLRTQKYWVFGLCPYSGILRTSILNILVSHHGQNPLESTPTENSNCLHHQIVVKTGRKVRLIEDGSACANRNLYVCLSDCDEWVGNRAGLMEREFLLCYHEILRFCDSEKNVYVPIHSVCPLFFLLLEIRTLISKTSRSGRVG